MLPIHVNRLFDILVFLIMNGSYWRLSSLWLAGQRKPPLWSIKRMIHLPVPYCVTYYFKNKNQSNQTWTKFQICLAIWYEVYDRVYAWIWYKVHWKIEAFILTFSLWLENWINHLVTFELGSHECIFYKNILSLTYSKLHFFQ